MTLWLAINTQNTFALVQQYCSSQNTGSDFAAGMSKPNGRGFGVIANRGHLGRVHSLRQFSIERGVLYILRRLRFRRRSIQELLVLQLYPIDYFIGGLLWRGLSRLSL